jgi:hypothetical protein
MRYEFEAREPPTVTPHKFFLIIIIIIIIIIRRHTLWLDITKHQSTNTSICLVAAMVEMINPFGKDRPQRQEIYCNVQT